MVGIFFYQLVSGHWRLQTGVTGIEKEVTVTAAMVIPLATVVGLVQQSAEWVDVAWLAMPVHVGKMHGKEGGVDVIDVQGEDVDAPPHPAAQSGKPTP